jgi:peptide chain release factor 2
LLIEKSSILKKIDKLNYFNVGFSDLLELFNLAKNDNDFSFLKELYANFSKLKSEYLYFEMESFFSLEKDYMDAFLDINAGSGGIESQDWVNMLFKMYAGWANKHGFEYFINSITYGDVAGLKNISIRISGKYAFGFLKFESGVHRLVRKSPFDSNNKRHTSFASVFVYPVYESNDNVEIVDSDLKIDTYRSSGAGGQHVNTTESAVRIIHIPTKIVVQCQSERSQHQNRAHALKQLKSKLYEFKLLEKKRNKQELEESKLAISWGSQIRSYILDKAVIKDLRTGLEFYDVDLVLSGYLDPFIFSTLNG